MAITVAQPARPSLAGAPPAFATQFAAGRCRHAGRRRPRSAVVSHDLHDYWRRDFPRNPAALAARIRADRRRAGQRFTGIVAIAAAQPGRRGRARTAARIATDLAASESRDGFQGTDGAALVLTNRDRQSLSARPAERAAAVVASGHAYADDIGSIASTGSTCCR